ncbi:NAD-dependent epimerase/dehydratase family protein, partial [Streptomyces sp. NPDC059446]|uniref:NAD-dependent epimerase/dehydratase family protein n=1 Tax=Streptomyces sp. NPDC059446 TaxID=3346833 RepID=UPI003679C304
MSPVRVLLTGSTGFVGRAVLRRLLDERAEGRDVEVRAVTRGDPAAGPVADGVERVRADLSDPGSLTVAARGTDVLVHLACRVEGDAEECERTNVGGTRAVVDAARRAGVGRIVQLSTAAVYGPGPHRGISVDEVTPAPVSGGGRGPPGAPTRLHTAAGGGGAGLPPMARPRPGEAGG